MSVPQTVPAKKRRRWGRWLVVAGVLLLVAPIAWVVGVREWTRAEGEREYAAAVAETDATDPDWRWDALADKRVIPPPERNSAAVVDSAAAKLPPAWAANNVPKDWDASFPDQPANRKCPADTLAAARTQIGVVEESVRIARTLKHYPDGNRAIVLAPDVIGTLLPHMQPTRNLATLLRWDAAIVAAEGDRQLAADDLLASLNNSRSIGDEPFLISQLIRIATRNIAARSLEHVLGVSELPEPELAELQAAWAKDAEEPLLLYGLRGERASFDVLMKNLIDGTLNPTPGPSTLRSAMKSPPSWASSPAWPHDRSFLHQYTSRAITAARLPIQEQTAAFAKLPPLPDADGTLTLTRLLLPAIDKMNGSYLQSVADARCVVVALACERYRLRAGKWPTQLADLPKDLLAEVPLDPYDGQPLRYKALDDGVVIYALGKNRTDDGGAVKHFGPYGDDDGFRLWNPSSRGLPPEPMPDPPADADR